MSNVKKDGIWITAEKQITEKLSAFDKNLILDKIILVSEDDKKISLKTDSPIANQTFNNKLMPQFKTKLSELAGHPIDIELELVEDTFNKNTLKDLSQTNTKDAVQNNKTKTSNANKKRTADNAKLNPRFKFENFVISENNEFAANAAKTISENIGTTYNPFLIYGGVGLGKTHLMESIGHAVLENTDKTVIYLTAEDFMNDFVTSLRENKMGTFKKKYRNVDVLLLDDIQFFQGKEELQNEFFYTFNHLYDTHKQMVFTCDRPPNILKRLDERLQSRFAQGLNVDLKPPSYEARYAILKRRLEEENETLPEDVIELVAKNISTNVRDLIAAMTKLTAYSKMTKKTMTVEKTLENLKDFLIDKKQGNINLDKILKVVAEHFDISVPDIRSKKRSQKIVTARHFSMFLAKEMTKMSTTEIGDEVGNRDHATVLHSCEKIENLRLTDPTVENTLEQLKNKLQKMLE